MFGPSYKPTLVSNNEAFLPEKGQIRHAKIAHNMTG